MTPPNDQQCPECGTSILVATGIGPFCPNMKCSRIDDLDGTGRKPVASEAVDLTPESYESSRYWRGRFSEKVADCAAKDARIAELDAYNRRHENLYEQLAAAKEALRKYGRHSNECLSHDDPCTCGYDAALSPPPAPEVPRG